MLKRWNFLKTGFYEGINLAAVATNGARSTFTQINTWHKARFRKSMRRYFGIRVDLLRDTPIDLEARVRENVGLVRTIPERFHAGLAQKIEAIQMDAPFDQQKLRSVLRREYKSSGYNLRRLTRDQTSKLTGQLNQARQTELGIDRYRWETSGDERVRPTHNDNDGQVFAWDDPPAATRHPGEDVQWRCGAIAVIESRQARPPAERKWEGATVDPGQKNLLSRTASEDAIVSANRHRRLEGYVDQYENKALGNYTETGYKSINYDLRNKLPLNKNQQVMYDAIHEASQPIGKDLMLHRSVGHSRASYGALDDVGRAWMNPEVGQVLTDRAFVSHSLAPQNAEIFMNGLGQGMYRRVYYQVRAPRELRATGQTWRSVRSSCYPTRRSGCCGSKRSRTTQCLGKRVGETRLWSTWRPFPD